MSSEGSDIAEGIIPEKIPEHISPLKSEFLPWHKVRKQYVRRYQWNELTKRNVNGRWRTDLQRPSSSTGHSAMHISQPLKCLVIPGNQLLDVRSMWTEIRPLDCFIRYLGFNESQGSAEVGTDVYVSNNAVTSLAGVVPDSQVLKDRFEAIAGDTIAYSVLKSYGPYHVVNLDLCGSMFPNKIQNVTPYYSALDRLLKYQFAAQKANWLLFITTMVEPGVVDKGLLLKLCEPTQQNYGYGEFSAKLKSLCPDATANSKHDTLPIENVSGHELISLFGVALGKWLLRLGQTASPSWTVGMRRSFKYSIKEDKGAVMLSLAFEMTPNIAPPVDRTGMSTLPVTERKFPSELECGVKIAESVANIRDVDAKLASDAELKAALTNEAADLLQSAGYDRDAYVKWVEGGEVAAGQG